MKYKTNKNRLHFEKQKNNLLKFVIVSLFVLIYSNFFSIISWGSDYGGYINLANAINENNLSNYVNLKTEINSFSNTTNEPIYTPVGFSLIFLVSQFLHNWNLLIMKLVTPLALILIYLLLDKMLNKNYEKIIILLALFNPFIINQFRDLTTEITSLLFLLLGIHLNKLKSVYFIIAVLIRPSYFVFIIIYFLLQYIKQKKLDGVFSFIFFLISIQIFFSGIYNINFYGLYSLTESGASNIGLLKENLLSLKIGDVQFIFYEFGRLFSTISHPANLFFGISIFALLVYANNIYSYMSVGFMLFHLLWVNNDYVRFFLPLVVLVFLSFLEKIRELELGSRKLNIILTSALLVLIPYGYQIKQTVDLVDIQRGPYQVGSQLMFDYVNKNYSEELFSFHSARVFTLFTNKKSYKIDQKIISKTVIICEYNVEDCKIPKNYKIVYENNLYKIFEPLS